MRCRRDRKAERTCGRSQGVKGKQVENLCELVTVSTENGCEFPIIHRDVTGFWPGKADGCLRMYEPGNLPHDRYRALPGSRVIGRTVITGYPSSTQNPAPAFRILSL